jgi:anti-sigma B factor antagonist
MNLQMDTRAGVTVMRPHGRLDLVTAPGVKQQIAETIADGHVRLVIDLASVTFIDSSGLGLLIGSLKAARIAGGDLRIARPTEQARVILELTTLDQILQPHGSLEEALGVFEQTLAG